MILDAIGADQIRAGLATATATAQEYTAAVGALAGILAQDYDQYEQRGLAASTLELLRDAATKLTSARTVLDTSVWELQEATADFTARDGRVAEAVADAGNLMQAAGYAETFSLPGTGADTPGPAPVAVSAGAPDQPGAQPQMSPQQLLLAMEDIRNGMAWTANFEGNPYWRPSALTPELSAQLTDDDAADDAAESRGLPAPDRPTCHTHQSWMTDCIADPSHSNPGLADGSVPSFNWCVDHRLPVQVCQCWPATVDGRAPTATDTGPVADPAAVWANSYRMSPKPVATGALMGDDEFQHLLAGGLPERRALQARTDGEWTEVPIRDPASCDHRNGLCADCTTAWSQRERLRVVEYPPAYEAPAQESGDEFYAYPGDLHDGKPPYWTRREGRIVVSQSLGGPVTRTEHPDLDTARAAFAEDSCDPGGAGAPRVHDLIKVHWGEHECAQLRVSSVTRGPDRGEYTLQAQAADGGTPLRVNVHFGQYQIVRRRAAPRKS